MRYLIKTFVIAFAVFLAVLINSCEKEERHLPVIITNPVSNISQRTALSGGHVIAIGAESLLGRGICWSDSSGPTINNNHTTESGDLGPFVSIISGLKPATHYYVRAYATNKIGTRYGAEFSFYSDPVQGPDVSTVQVSSITSTSALSGGIIGYDGGGVPVIAKGVCWSTSSLPDLQSPHTMDGPGVKDFVSQISGLSGNTTYFVRAYATNSAGTSYGLELSFKTISDSAANVLFNPILFNSGLTYGTVTDAAWNVYKTIRIGTQIWMAENLKTNLFNTGEQIANVEVPAFWTNYTLDAFCWYKNDIAYKTNYGALYNWYAVKTGKLCPTGWHVPSNDDFTTLISYLGGESSAGGKLKESETTHWVSPNSEGNNESGFSGLPGGYLTAENFMSIRTEGYWWSSTESNSVNAFFINLKSSNGSAITASGLKTNGLSVRCVKD